MDQKLTVQNANEELVELCWRHLTAIQKGVFGTPTQRDIDFLGLIGTVVDYYVELYKSGVGRIGNA